MRIIYTHRFPSGDFHGINMFGSVFVQRRWGKFLPYEVNHEMIHSYQQWELTYLVFYTLYVLEFLVRLVQCRWDTDRAYRSISFEREAFAHERDFQYLRHRRPCTWLRFWVDKG